MGDMIAGTLVIQDATETLNGPRARLSGRSAAESHFRFDAGQLKKLQPQDVPSIERLLSRWHEIPFTLRDELLSQIMPGLCGRLGVDPPDADAGDRDTDARHRFLEDLLAAEYRRQDRQLG